MKKVRKKTDKIDTEKVTKLDDLKGWTPLKIVPEKLSGTSEVYGEQGSTPLKSAQFNGKKGWSPLKVPLEIGVGDEELSPLIVKGGGVYENDKGSTPLESDQFL